MPLFGLIHHSDQGGHVSLAFGRAVREAGIAVSMGFRGTPTTMPSPRRSSRPSRRELGKPPQLAVAARAPIGGVRVHRGVAGTPPSKMLSPVAYEQLRLSPLGGRDQSLEQQQSTSTPGCHADWGRSRRLLMFSRSRCVPDELMPYTESMGGGRRVRRADSPGWEVSSVGPPRKRDARTGSSAVTGSRPGRAQIAEGPAGSH